MTALQLSGPAETMSEAVSRVNELTASSPLFRSKRKGDGVKPTRHLFSSHHLGAI
jgi:hypothetical protein